MCPSSVLRSHSIRHQVSAGAMNILLTFAQFERELLSDRIRDSLHALRRRGLPFGAQAPIGYDKVNGRFVINPTEAEIVRDAFRLYPQMKNVHQLARHMQAAGIRSKRQVSKEGKSRGGGLIPSATVYRMLCNPLYLGKYLHEGEWFEGHTTRSSRSLNGTPFSLSSGNVEHADFPETLVETSSLGLFTMNSDAG